MHTSPLSIRVASQYLEATRMISAKNQWLKALDFTFNVLNRMERQGYNFNGPTLPEIKARLIYLRKLIQTGGSGPGIVERLEDQVGRLTHMGERIVKSLTDREKNMLPDHADWVDFLQKYPDNVKTAVRSQSANLRSLIAKKTGKSQDEISLYLQGDASFASDAYNILTPFFQTALQEIQSRLSGFGTVQARVKKFPSAYKKAQDRNVSFVDLGDLVGARVVTPDVKTLASACSKVQGSFDILGKDNKYLDNRAYLAVHYDLGASNGLVMELQVKSDANLIEAAISHDLIHKPEMSLISLTAAEKKLIQRMIDISLSVSLREMQRLWEAF